MPLNPLTPILLDLIDTTTGVLDTTVEDLTVQQDLLVEGTATFGAGTSLGEDVNIFGTVLIEPTGSYTPRNSTAWASNPQFRFGYNFNNSSQNEYVFQVHAHLPSTGITGAYQKTALLVYATTAEDDTLDNGSVVGIDTTGGVLLTQGGRAWGLVAKAAVSPTYDGTLFGAEFDIINEGTDVSTPGLDKQKLGVLISAFGSQPSTAAIALASGGNTWHHGFFSYTSALGTAATDSFVELSTKFCVRPTGFIVFGNAGPQVTYGSGTPEAAVTAPVGSIYLRSNGGAGTSIYVKESGAGNTGWVGK